MPCAIYRTAKRMLVKVGSGSNGDSFELKGAEWTDVKAGSLDANVTGRRLASVPSMRPLLQLERQRPPRHRTSSSLTMGP